MISALKRQEQNAAIEESEETTCYISKYELGIYQNLWWKDCKIPGFESNECKDNSKLTTISAYLKFRQPNKTCTFNHFSPHTFWQKIKAQANIES